MVLIFFFSTIFFLSNIYLFYKKFENLVFYDFISNHRYHGINNDHKYELDDLISKIKKSKNLKKTKFVKKQNIRSFMKFFDKFKASKESSVGLNLDESYLADEIMDIVPDHEVLNNFYLRTQFILNGKNEFVFLKKQYIKNIDDHFFYKQYFNSFYLSTDLYSEFKNNYNLSFNISNNEAFLANVYNNYVKIFTPEDDFEYNSNLFDDYKLKFQQSDTILLKMLPLKHIDFSNKWQFTADLYYKSFKSNYKFSRFANFKKYLQHEKFSLDDYRIGEHLSVYVERLNSLTLKFPHDFIFYKKFEFFPNSKLFQKNFFNLEKTNIDFTFSEFENKFYLLFNVLINKKVLVINNKVYYLLLYLYFKLFFFSFKLKNSGNLFLWLFLLHFVVFKKICKSIFNKKMLFVFIYFFPIMLFFCLLNRAVKLINYTAFFFSSEKIFEFLNLFVNTLICLPLVKQINLFKLIFIDIKVFVILFLKSCYSYYFFVSFVTKYKNIFKLGVLYNFFFFKLFFSTLV